MSVRQRLVEEHDWLDRALNDLACAAEGGDPAEVRRAWGELEPGLLRHLELEERELFPLAEPFHGEAMESLRREHERLKSIVTELGVRADLHTLRKQAIDELVETLRRHAEREDKTLYHWLEHDAPEDSRRHVLGLLGRTVLADITSASDHAARPPASAR